MKTESIQRVIAAMDPVNVDYIMQDEHITAEFRWASRMAKLDRRAAAFHFRRAKEEVAKFHETHLTPETIRVGDGVTVNSWSDRYAATVIKATKNMVVVRRDTAILDPNFKPEFIIGGFCAHCTNQSDQTYNYRPNPEGEEYKIYWSKKYRRYGQPGEYSLSKGRHEFYDYNF